MYVCCCMYAMYVCYVHMCVGLSCYVMCARYFMNVGFVCTVCVCLRYACYVCMLRTYAMYVCTICILCMFVFANVCMSIT